MPSETALEGNRPSFRGLGLDHEPRHPRGFPCKRPPLGGGAVRAPTESLHHARSLRTRSGLIPADSSGSATGSRPSSSPTRPAWLRRMLAPVGDPHDPYL